MTIHYADLHSVLYCGDALECLSQLPDRSVQCCVTSPPYWGLRDYGVSGQLGLEASPQEYVDRLVFIFKEVRRVLADDGTLWFNIGDSYSARLRQSGKEHAGDLTRNSGGVIVNGKKPRPLGFKEKDLIGIPWMVAFALRDDGWFLRSDIVWNKPNPMPESVTDRPTRSHEYIFLLSKKSKYFYDYEAIKEPPSLSSIERINQPNFANQTGGSKDYANGTNGNRSMRKTLENWAEGRRDPDKQRGHGRRHNGFNERWDKLTVAEQGAFGRNKRDVWTVPPANFDGAHFATFPPDLIRPCIRAGSRPGDTILDPFAGTFTTGLVAIEEGRKAIGIELNPAYCELAKQRTNITPQLPMSST